MPLQHVSFSSAVNSFPSSALHGFSSIARARLHETARVRGEILPGEKQLENFGFVGGSGGRRRVLDHGNRGSTEAPTARTVTITKNAARGRHA